MEKKSTASIVIFAIALIASLICQLAHADEAMNENQIEVARYEWDGVHYRISLADLKSAIQKLPRHRRDGIVSKERQAEYLDELADEKLMVLEAINRRLDTDASLLKSVEDYQQQQMVRRLIEIEVDEKTAYTEADLETHYQAHRDAYWAKAETHATCISLPSRHRAQEALDQIKNGKDIAELAAELSRKGELKGPGETESDPGKTRLFDQTDYPRWGKFADAVFALEIGEMTKEVFEIEVSNIAYYMIFRKDAYIPKRHKHYDEVKDEVERKVREEKKRLRFGQWMSAVRHDAKFVTYPDRLPHPSAMDGAEPRVNADETSDVTIIAEFECDGKRQITLAEIRDELGNLPEFAKRDYKGRAGFEKYMNLMAESRLMLCLAKEQKIDEEEKIIEEVREYQHNRLIDKVTALEVDRKLKLTEEDYRRYYEKHKADYFQPEKVRLTCITLRYKELAEQAFQRIQDGEDIIEIATELSDRGELTEGPGSNLKKPGDTGFFTHASYVERAKTFADAAFALEVGEMVEAVFPIEVQGEGYYLIFRKEEVREARQPTFEEDWLRRRVEKDAERQERQNLTEAWISRLREKAHVKTFPNRISESR